MANNKTCLFGRREILILKVMNYGRADQGSHKGQTIRPVYLDLEKY
jgi:hypothetical protein